jgi:Ca2+/Na+ antiporter
MEALFQIGMAILFLYFLATTYPAFLFLCVVVAVVAFLWKKNRDEEQTRKSDEMARQEKESRDLLKKRAEDVESKFYEVTSIPKQYECLKDLSYVASSLGNIYGNSIWVKIEAACRLLKRNCASGEHDRYWILADELHKAAQTEITEYNRL